MKKGQFHKDEESTIDNRTARIRRIGVHRVIDREGRVPKGRKGRGAPISKETSKGGGQEEGALCGRTRKHEGTSRP